MSVLVDFVKYVVLAVGLFCLLIPICYSIARTVAIAWHRTKIEFDLSLQRKIKDVEEDSTNPKRDPPEKEPTSWQ